MPDRFASIASEFIHAAFPETGVPFYQRGEGEEARLIYAYIATHHPELELTPKLVARVTWSVRMQANWPKGA